MVHLAYCDEYRKYFEKILHGENNMVTDYS